MKRVCELNLQEFTALEHTDVMIVFVTNKFEVTTAEVEVIRAHATLPFFIRSADYPNGSGKHVAYFSHQGDMANILRIIEEADTKVPTTKNILSINTKINKD